MDNNDKTQFSPDYLVTPGEILEEYLSIDSITQSQLAQDTGLTIDLINDIIKGTSSITTDIAQPLARFFDCPDHFWNNLERQFQEDRLRLEKQSRLKLDLFWMKTIPVSKMTKLGWMKRHKDEQKQLNEVFNFFDVTSQEQWNALWKNYRVDIQQNKHVGIRLEAVSAWMRQGEIAATGMSCSPFNKEQFAKTLIKIRTLTRIPYKKFRPKLIKWCAEAGVAVVFVRELSETEIYSATRWFGTKAVIQVILRYQQNNIFWSTFFHEACHILRHDRKKLFLSGNNPDDDNEIEADKFAQDVLIPPKKFQSFLNKWDGHHLPQISDFAKTINIHPGIVVGRLRQDGFLIGNHGNSLLVTLCWAKP